MLNWTNVGLARAYLLFAFLAQLGTLQLVATAQRWQGLSLVGIRPKSKLGYVVGGALLALSYGWFFGFRRDIYAPGPAGVEVTILFCGAAVLAIGVTLALAEIRRRVQCSRVAKTRRADHRDACIQVERFRLEVEEIAEWGAMGRVPVGASFSGVLFLPSPKWETFPAICLVPGPFTDNELAHWIITELVGIGFVVLLVELEPQAITYPEVLAVVPSALSYLRHLPQIDAQRVGAVGLDMGGDIVMRAASTDARIRMVATIGPLLVERPGGMALLKEMTFGQAWLWSSLRRREAVIAALDALASLSKLEKTPVLLVMGSRDPVAAQVRKALDGYGLEALQLRLVSGESRATLYRNRAAAWAVVSWMREGLIDGA